MVAAIVLVAGIGVFAVSQSDHGTMGAYYYFSGSPDPQVNEVRREFAIENKIPQAESANTHTGGRQRDRRPCARR